MKYLHDNGFRVLTLKQIGYDTQTNSFYLKNSPEPNTGVTTNTTDALDTSNINNKTNMNNKTPSTTVTTTATTVTTNNNNNNDNLNHPSTIISIPHIRVPEIRIPIHLPFHRPQHTSY
jgi:hypothetical protein